MLAQNYEQYWKLTLEYSDIHSEKFIGTLEIIKNSIDKQCDYDAIQNNVDQKYPKKDKASVRKSINQFVKLGFINNLSSYNIETIEFLNAKTKKKRNSIFSKVVYKYSKFNSSITKSYNWNQINFLIKTLEEVGKLSKEDIIGLMLVDILSIQKGYLNENEVIYYKNKAHQEEFIKRKYNQISYLFNILKKLDDIVFVDNMLYLEEDANVIFGGTLKQNSRKRDNYLHRIYKNLLKEEVETKLSYTQCMIEKLAYPSLVASHIKPFIDSNEIEAYDPNNGLLLSRNFDILFDQGYITFNSYGNIICSNSLNIDVANSIHNFHLDSIFLNNERLKYLDYHQKFIFQR